MTDEHFRKWFYDTDDDGRYPGERIEWMPQHIEEVFMAGRHSVAMTHEEVSTVHELQRLTRLEQQLGKLIRVWRARLSEPERAEIGHESPDNSTSSQQHIAELRAVIHGKMKL